MPELLTVDAAVDYINNELRLPFKVSRKQLYRAIEPKRNGERKLPFFRDPITQRLLINTDALRQAYKLKPDKAE